MKLITTDDQVRQNIPNVLVTVEGEATLLEKLTPFIEQAETWLATNFTSSELLQAIAAEQGTPLKELCTRIVITEAFRAAIPSLDVILTPNGFGIVNNSTVVPASRDRVERLILSLESARDELLISLLRLLPAHQEWLATEQAAYFSSTMFPNISMCREIGIRDHLWQEYQAFVPQLQNIERVLAETYFSEAQMQVFRQECMLWNPSTQPIMRSVIITIRQLILMVLMKHELHVQQYYDVVNIIREHPNVFPAWHSSPVAELYAPPVFKNKKSSSAYWF